MPGTELAQVAVLPWMVSPNWSRATAVSCTVSPTCGVSVGLVTATVVVTRAVMLSDSEPDTPLIVAVATTEPPASACSRPVDDTVATDGAELDHVAVPGTTSPDWSRATAVNCNVSPCFGVSVGLVTVTEVIVRTGSLPSPSPRRRRKQSGSPARQPPQGA